MRLVTSLMALTAVLLVLPAVSGASDLHLNEVLAGPASDWDGSGGFSSRDDEWVEVFNFSMAPLELTPYFLTDGDKIPRYRFTGWLDAGRHRVVYGSQATEWERANGFPAYGLSLGNSGDAVMLWEVAGGETLLVDSLAYDSHAAAPDRSLGRLNDTDEWQLFDSLDPYNGTASPSGNGCAPTPGTSNICGVTPARSIPWGRIKAIYH